MRRDFFLLGMMAASVPLFAQNKATDSIRERRIEEVVVTSSYGTKKLKEEVVGAMTTISAQDIQLSQPAESLDKMIAGLAPGLQIANSSEIAKPVNINIRGLGSLVNLGKKPGVSTQPLIIVDGIIMREDRAFDATMFDGGTNAESLINPLARLPVDNIASVTILKDAAAVSLYGADAANGVILITTRHGAVGKPRYTFSSQYGVSTSMNEMKYLSGPQYAELYNTFSENMIPPSSHPWNGVDVDWFKVMNQPGDYFKTNFGVSGGSKFINYRFGLDYSKTNESKVKNTFEKYGADATVGINFNKLKANLFASYNELVKNDPNQYFNFILSPEFAIYKADGSYNPTGYKGIPNPLAAANQNISNLKNHSLLSSLNLEYHPMKDLKISTLFGVDWSKKTDTDWRSGLNESGQNAGSFKTPDGKSYPRNGESRISKSDALKWNWSVQAYYEKNFAKNHHVDVLLGAEIRKTKDDKTADRATYFTDASYYRLPWEAATYLDSDGKLKNNYKVNSLTQTDAGRSAFSQVNYDFRKKYFLSATLRRDESSSFGTDRNAAVNGGIGASWLINKENFLKNAQWVDMLRLRASWGRTGNSRIGSYRSSGLYTISQTAFSYNYPIATPDVSAPPNKDLGWLKNEMYNLGLDFSILRRVEFTVDVYRNSISDMIITRDTPPETGYSSAEINGGAMYNQGVEFSARAYWFRRKDFQWSTKFNISTVKNKVTYLQGFGDDFSESELARAQKVGYSTSAIWGYQYAGVDPANGQSMYMLNGVATDQNKMKISARDYVVIGNTQPGAIGGITNNISYKNFTLGFQINFELGGNILASNVLIDKYSNLLNRNMSVNALDYWTTPGQIAQNQKPVKIDPIVNSTKYIYDNTHFKLQNVTLGYRIPLQKGRAAFIRTAEVYADATNVAYWYKQKSPAGRNGVRELMYPYPEMRTVSFGFRLNF